MAANKRTAAQVEIDMALEEDLHIKGHSARLIAEAIAQVRPYALSRQQVAHDLRRLQKRWQTENRETVNEHRMRELKGLAAQERELWEAWEKSKLDAERHTEETTTGGKDGSKDKTALVKEGQCGDATFQRLILEVRDRRVKLLGLEAPARSEISGPGGGPIQTQGIDDLSEAELEKLLLESKRIDGLKENAKPDHSDAIAG